MKSQLALKAGNTAVLEKHHLAEFWGLVEQSSKTDIFAGVNKAEVQQHK